MKPASKLHAHKSAELSLEDLTVEFESPEFPHHHKNELWYLGIGILLIVGLVLTLSQGQYLFALVVVAIGVAVFRLATVRPHDRQISISPVGIKWGDQLFGYHQLKAFWAAEHGQRLTVYLERPNSAPIIHFEVPETAIDRVLTFLSLELPFHFHKNEPLSDRVSRLLKL